VVRAGWKFFEEWCDTGIAVCEDVNSPMHSSHPIREKWRKYYGERRISLWRDLDPYVNGGFVGVSRANIEFLDTWAVAIRSMEERLGNLNQWNIGDRTFEFQKTDQDALNIALMATHCPISIVGKEGMDFVPGGYIMSHAIGPTKPWNTCFTLEAIRGRRLSRAQREYLARVTGPIHPHTRVDLLLKRFDASVARVLGRFFA
jgi:hypothetical protein